jgi:hypothetical protein
MFLSFLQKVLYSDYQIRNHGFTNNSNYYNRQFLYRQENLIGLLKIAFLAKKQPMLQSSSI